MSIDFFFGLPFCAVNAHATSFEFSTVSITTTLSNSSPSSNFVHLLINRNNLD